MYSYFVRICTVWGDPHKHVVGLCTTCGSEALVRKGYGTHHILLVASGIFHPFPAAYMAPFDLRALGTPDRQLPVPFSLSIYLLPIKIMGYLNVNENLQSGWSWSPLRQCL